MSTADSPTVVDGPQRPDPQADQPAAAPTNATTGTSESPGGAPSAAPSATDGHGDSAPDERGIAQPTPTSAGVDGGPRRDGTTDDTGAAASLEEPTADSSGAPTDTTDEPRAAAAPAPSAHQTARDAEPTEQPTEQPAATGTGSTGSATEGASTGQPDGEISSHATRSTGSDGLSAEVTQLREQGAQALTALTGLTEQLIAVSDNVAELSRLRRRDADLVDRLHADITRLRAGEVAQAITPVVLGMLKVHDQMVSLGALTDPSSIPGMLHTQLLQSLELTAGVKPFSPERGEKFDASRHTGVRRIPTSDTNADGTVAATVKAGFTRADGSLVRAAEVEVHRLSG